MIKAGNGNNGNDARNDDVEMILTDCAKDDVKTLKPA